jgi:hypothetical protein
MINVRTKGKVAELEVIRLLRDTMLKVEAWLPPDLPRHAHRLQRNSLQSAQGGFDVAGLPGIALEIKRCETLAIEAWWRQCIEQATKAPGCPMPVLVWRQSRMPWTVRSWVQITDGAGTYEFVIAQYPLQPAFLNWYAKFYRKFLLTQADSTTSL